MEDFYLHFTGDFHAVTTANNLLAAQLEARILHEYSESDEVLFLNLVPIVNGRRIFSNIQLKHLKKLGIDKTDPDTLTAEEITRFSRLNINPDTITWQRVVNTNDHFLREVQIKGPDNKKGFTRNTGFSTPVASEIMAILTLSVSLEDLYTRIGNIVVALDRNGQPITPDDLGATGAMTILLKDAIEPTLVQTLEGTPVFVHGSSFKNIGHGCSSVIADNMALKLVGKDGYVVTEAGFGLDTGLEKFCNIKCRTSGIFPNTIVLVTTISTLKSRVEPENMHPELLHDGADDTETNDVLARSIEHLTNHIKTATLYGVPVIVAINSSKWEHFVELDRVKKAILEAGAYSAVICESRARGGAGAKKLAESVIDACKSAMKFRYLYDLSWPLEKKMSTIAEKIYGAQDVVYSEQAQKHMDKFQKQGYDKLPVCVAITPFSLSADPRIEATPAGFKIQVDDILISAGARFVVVTVGEICHMPGLGIRPIIYDMDIDKKTGMIKGLF